MRALLKVMRDLWQTRGRVAFMVVALAAGLTSTGAVLGMRSVVQREMSRAYLETVPASATLDVGQTLGDAQLAELRGYPEVAAAERRATREGRWRRADGSTGRALVFAVEDLGRTELVRVEPVSGVVPPSSVGGILVERVAMQMLGARVGDSLELRTAAGPAVPLEIVGVVRDPALAPATQEQAAYVYLSPETFALLGETALDEVRVLVADDPLDEARVETQVSRVVQRLEAAGVPVHEVRIPPPGRHPHQGPSEAILLLFGIFSMLTVGLAAVLSASLLSLTMARQVREVAVMKTLGATRSQIAQMYAVMIGIIAVSALLVSAPPTLLLARTGIDAVSGLLNFAVASYAIPLRVLLLQVGLGLALPVLAALPAIARASGGTVQAALNEHGVRTPSGSQRLLRFLEGRGNRVLAAGIRNALRLPRRLAWTVALLGVAGGLFITASSVSGAWDALTGQLAEDRHDDVEVRLAQPIADETLALLAPWRAEAWAFAPAAWANDSGIPISRTWPDGGHGSLSVVGVPRTELVDFRVAEGRWLEAGEPEGAVLNQGAVAGLGGVALGDRVTVMVEGRPISWTVVGLVREVGAPAHVHVSAEAFTARVRSPRDTVRVGSASAGAGPTAGQVVERLEGAGVRVERVVPIALLQSAMSEHVGILVQSLLGLALLMAVVGAVALSSTMSASVVERTRELGVLRAMGARPAQIRWLVLVEGWFVSALSLPVAVLIAVPLSAWVGRVVGLLAFQLPLPLVLSWSAVLAWALGLVVLSTLASLVPAAAATGRSVRDAIAQV